MKQLRAPLVLLSLLVVFAGAAVAANADRHINATLTEVNGSGVSGRIELTAMPQGGTLVAVHVEGLHPGTQYVSLYYDNHQCDLEPYSPSDVVNQYTAPANGRADFAKRVSDSIDEINSVSVRLQQGFALQACATTH